MLKVELHSHTADDPEDYIPHTAEQLIDRAADLDYDAIAITLHNSQLDLTPLEAHAQERGVLLIPGVERDIDGKHVLLINFSTRSERVDSFADLEALKRDESAGLVVAPHPFFPTGSCLRGIMNRHPELFDAVEINAKYSPWVNFNRAATRWAIAHGRPLVGNGDVHRLEQLGSTHTRVDAEPTPDAICTAIRSGRVQVASTPLCSVERRGSLPESSRAAFSDRGTGRRPRCRATNRGQTRSGSARQISRLASTT